VPFLLFILCSIGIFMVFIVFSIALVFNIRGDTSGRLKYEILKQHDLIILLLDGGMLNVCYTKLV